jgi:hypothetical protein
MPLRRQRESLHRHGTRHARDLYEVTLMHGDDHHDNLRAKRRLPEAAPLVGLLIVAGVVVMTLVVTLTSALDLVK